MRDGLITINLGGKERTLKFNMRALEVLSEMKCTGDVGITSAGVVIYAGLMGWHYAKQAAPDFTFEDVSEWTEDMLMAGDVVTLNAINECFENSRAFKFVNENAKKKADQLNGQMSTPLPGAQSALNPESTTSLRSTST